MPDNRRCFNRRWLERPATGKRIKFGVFAREFAGLRIQLAHLDTTPEASHSQPHIAIRVDDEVRVNGVPVILTSGTDNLPFVYPAVAWAAWIERLVCDQTDGGMVAAES